jgi:hypothetical protein
MRAAGDWGVTVVKPPECAEAAGVGRSHADAVPQAALFGEASSDW